MDDYRERVVESLSRATGMSVSARAIRGGWEGLRPYISLEGFAINDRHGKVALGFERAEATISWWTLLLGDVRFHDVDFYRPSLALRRGTDGLVYLGDKPLNRTESEDSRFTEWLLAQPRLGIHEATLTWRDEKAQSPDVRLEQVEIALEQHRGRHQASLTAKPPADLARSIDLRADVAVVREGARWLPDGDVYMETRDADLGVLRTHMPVPESLRSGAGNVRVWMHVAPEGVKEVVADINMRDARAQLAADALPLDLATISGRAIYRAEIDGFTFATEKLRFHLANGVAAQLGNFSLSRRAEHGKPEHVDVRADGIDLKIAATLLDYFPVPRDVKGQVLRFAPRGRISDTTLSWTERQSGRAWSVKGRFEDLGVNAGETTPGVTGISGRIEGTQDQGSVEIDSKNVGFELARVFRAPLALERLESKATWIREGGVLKVTVADAHFANADAEGHVAGTWQALPGAKEPSPGYVDLKGTFSRAQAVRVADYIPNAATQARNWLDRAIVAGTTDHADFELKGDLHFFPFGAPDRPGRFLVAGNIKDGQLKYIPDWPSVDAIQGRFKFENRGMEIRADRALIFASRASNVSAVVEDLGAKPATLVVNGDVDTTGADSVRFLRESPLVNGPGAFTRAVAVEGPARLKLQLVAPLDGKNLRVNGDYTFAGATAAVGKWLTMRDVRGKLSFTERTVRAQQITGTLFDKPATLSVQTVPDVGVVTQVDGHLDTETMAGYVPAAIAAKLEGGADWSAQVTSGARGSELVVTSDLKGLAATLPEPFAKPADAPRDFRLTVSNLGADNQQSTFALGGAIFGRFGRSGERWNAALKFGAPVATEPVREGLWLYGELGYADADAWQTLFAAPHDAPKAQAGDEALALRGFDIKVARAHFWGRDFSDTAARLERDGAQWAGHVESPLVAGDVRWTWQGTGRMTGRFTRLSMRDPTTSGSESSTPRTDTDLPALDVTADRFEFKGHWLGKLELEAEPDGSDWRIDKLDIVNEHAKFNSSGRWHRAAGGSTTNLDVKIEADSLDFLLGQFGFKDTIRRGTGKLEGGLVWPGYPYDFAVANATGSFKVEAHKGQFAKIDPGAGKLLGLVSLQSLPSRATFDFRDVFSEGFAFDKIAGDMKLGNGVLRTSAFEISGPAAFVSMRGEVSLSRETQDLNLHIVPEVGEGIAVAAAVIGTPVLGLSTLLVTKLLNNPFGKVVAYEYQVTGSWDNPQVARLSAPPPAKTAAVPEPVVVRSPQP